MKKIQIEKRFTSFTILQSTRSALTYTVSYRYVFLSLFLSEMSTVSRNLKLWNGARDGDNDAVLAAIAAGVDVNWKNDSEVSDNDI